jgi:general secretion pathway protein C
LDTQWLDTTGDKLGDALQQAAQRLQALAEPGRQRQIRNGLYLLACLWLLFSIASLIWNLLPQPEAAVPQGQVINPLGAADKAGERRDINIEELAGWNLFGTPASKPSPEAIAAAEAAAAAASRRGSLDGIENNAKETRLSLKLQGIVASTDMDAARAIIESKKKQEQYAVGDKLPVSGKVTIAKILADRVVLDNSGRYELLLLFDESTITGAPMQPAQSAPAERKLDRRGDRQVTQMAESYRQRLYSNPQSLSDVVKIAAVREGGRLRGYRVSAGRDRKQFEGLGFKANDVVTGVNGIELTDPGKAMELYRIMRTADEASFSVLRGDEELTLVVGLKNPADSQ